MVAENTSIMKLINSKLLINLVTLNTRKALKILTVRNADNDPPLLINISSAKLSITTEASKIFIESYVYYIP